MRNLKRAGTIWAAALIAAAGYACAGAQAQELSEKSLRSFMDYAWQLTPSKFTRPDGRTIEVDKKKREEVTVPLESAREIIRVGRLSAHAQVCELAVDQVNNYRSLMLREEGKKKWTEQQLIYINQLHLTTVMMLTGKIKLVDREGEKEVVVEESKLNAQTCSEEHRQKVGQMIQAYVKTGPPLNTASAAPPPTTTGSSAPAAVMPAAATAKPGPASASTTKK